MPASLCAILAQMSDLPLKQAYSPEFVEAELSRAGPLRGAWRVLQVLRVLVALLLLRRLDRWQWTHLKGETEEDRQRRRAAWLLDRIVWLGPAFVKLGQSLATRPDLLPLPYMQVLSQLYDQLPSFSDEVACSVIEEELGWAPDALFRHFERQSFAAASLGQVYRAITFSGREVAVKVQRPGMQRVISLDLALLRRLAARIERSPRLGRGQPWVSILDEFGAKLFEELDYIHEAHLTERFRANVAGMPGVDAPRVHWEMTSRHVLTTDFVSGIKVTDKKALAEAGMDIRALLIRGVRANLRQLFEDGFFHADPHPGNLLVRPEDGALVFLDFGMMGIIRPEQQERLIEIFVDVINRRPDRLQSNLIALGCLRPDAQWDELLPLADQMFRSVFGDQERTHTFQEVTSAFAPLVYKYEFRIPLDFAYVVRALMMLEGVARQLDPDFDIFAVSAPYAARMMLTVPGPSLRQRLMDELITPDGKLDWTRLDQIATLASRDGSPNGGLEGLVSPALDMFLSAEGAALRSALIAEVFKPTEAGTEHRLEGIASLLSSDPAIPGRLILDRVVAYLLSDAGAQTRAQIAQAIRVGGDQKLNLAAVVSAAAAARRLHPDLRVTRVLAAAAKYLLSEPGQPARAEILAAGRRWLVGAVLPRSENGRQRIPALPTAAAIAQQESTGASLS